jgi:hypothetical protein
VRIAGVAHSPDAEKLHMVTIGRGKVLLGVQSGFVITDPIPIHFYDDKTQLIDLAQTGIEQA